METIELPADGYAPDLSNINLRAIISILSSSDDPEYIVAAQLELESRADQLHDHLDYYIDEYASLMIQADGIRDWIKKKSEQAQILTKRADKMKEYLVRFMQVTGQARVSTGVHTLRLRENPGAVQVIDESLVPDAYKIAKQVVTVDKTALKKDLVSGLIVDGATFTKSWRVDIK